jgi:putative PIN family toxin of toxin-antitoxin system
MRLVLDTNVVASALLWGGTPRQLLEAARDGRIELFTSPPLLTELTEILARSKFARKIASSAFAPDQLIDRYSMLAAPVSPTPIPRAARDPDDDLVLGTALTARADLIVTGDKDLLTLHPWRGIRILNVAATLQHLATAEAR